MTTRARQNSQAWRSNPRLPIVTVFFVKYVGEARGSGCFFTFAWPTQRVMPFRQVADALEAYAIRRVGFTLHFVWGYQGLRFYPGTWIYVDGDFQGRLRRLRMRWRKPERGADSGRRSAPWLPAWRIMAGGSFSLIEEQLGKSIIFEFQPHWPRAGRARASLARKPDPSWAPARRAS